MKLDVCMDLHPVQECPGWQHWSKLEVFLLWVNGLGPSDAAHLDDTMVLQEHTVSSVGNNENKHLWSVVHSALKAWLRTALCVSSFILRSKPARKADSALGSTMCSLTQTTNIDEETGAQRSNSLAQWQRLLWEPGSHVQDLHCCARLPDSKIKDCLRLHGQTTLWFDSKTRWKISVLLPGPCSPLVVLRGCLTGYPRWACWEQERNCGAIREHLEHPVQHRQEKRWSPAMWDI